MGSGKFMTRSLQMFGLLQKSSCTSYALLFLICLLPVAMNAQTLRVAAASDLQFVLPELATQYEKESGVKLEISYGSSGNFSAHIQNGAPFDVFFSADVSYAEALVKSGFAEPAAVHKYGVGKIVLWVPADSPIEPAKLGWDSLLQASVQKIAIANPEHAPYGRAARAALEKAGLLKRVESKLVFGENISQTAQFVQSGNAQIGFVALSLAVSPAMSSGKRWEVPQDSYPRIIQAAVVLKNSPNKIASDKFIAFLRTETARATFLRFGFGQPPAASVEPTR
jgi:molybdate transport system substrate-binding protein